MSFYRPRFLKEWNFIRQEGGYRLLFKKKGWVVFFCLLHILSYSRFNFIFADSLSCFQRNYYL